MWNKGNKNKLAVIINKQKTAGDRLAYPLCPPERHRTVNPLSWSAVLINGNLNAVLVSLSLRCLKMGSILSRRIAGVEDVDIQANSAYRYPPKSGKWCIIAIMLKSEKNK